MRNALRSVASCALLLLPLSSCGVGTAGLASGGGSTPTGNAAPQMANFEVVGARSPATATVRFLLSDPEGDAARVELLYRIDGTDRPASLDGQARLLTLPASREGTPHEFRWSFDAQAGLDAPLTREVLVWARVPGVFDEPQAQEGVHSRTVDLGNVAPAVANLIAPAEAVGFGLDGSGDIELRVTAMDSGTLPNGASGDTVDLKFEFNADAPTFPEESWRSARPAGLGADQPTPEYGVRDVVAAEEGTEFTFVWDSDFAGSENEPAQLAGTEVEVRVRASASDLSDAPDPEADRHLAGSEVLTAPEFFLDNNASADVDDVFVVGLDGSSSASRVSPATIAFSIFDAESDSVDAELHYRVEAADQAIAQLDPALPNPLASAAGGREHVSDWDFAAEPGLGSGFREDVLVWVRLPGVREEPTVGRNAIRIDLGNDVPVLTTDFEGFLLAATPIAEVPGIVHLPFRAADSSDDLVDFRVQFAIVDAVLDGDSALPAGFPAFVEADQLSGSPLLSFQDCTPEGSAPLGVAVARDGTDVDFFWDVPSDLPSAEHTVVLRVTPDDGALDANDSPVGIGASRISRAIRVDNNSEPIATISEALFALGDDRSRGIPITYTVRDAEGDETDVVFQWAPFGSSFPTLPTQALELRALLEDAEARRDAQIAEPFPVDLGGRLEPESPDQVRLPALATNLSHAADRMVGSTLELLAPDRAPVLVSGAWSEPPLFPAAAIPLESGQHLLVVDRVAGSNYRVRVVERTTGALVRTIAPSVFGFADVAALEPDGTHLIVAGRSTQQANEICLWRISLAPEDPAIEVLGCVSAPGLAMANVRFLRSLTVPRKGYAVVSVFDQLIGIEYTNGAITGREVLRILLAGGTGVAPDPRYGDRVYFAEFVGRVSSLNLETRNAHTLDTSDGDVDAIASPIALAFDNTTRELMALGRSGDNLNVHSIALDRSSFSSTLGSLASTQTFSAESLAADAGTYAITVFESHEIYVGGGVVDARNVVAYNPTTQVVTFDQPLTTLPTAQSRWRLRTLPGPIEATPEGVRAVFLWDSRPVTQARVIVRAIPIDTEIGVEAATEFGKDLVADYAGSEPLPTDGQGFAVSDLDHDGDLDMVLVRNSGLTLLEQTTPRTFVPGTIFGVGGGTVAAGDVNGDGRNDVVSSEIAVYLQDANGDFPFAGGNGDIELSTDTNDIPAVTRIADISGNGRVDILVGNALFLQDLAGNFPGADGVGQAPDVVLLDDAQVPEPLDVTSAEVGDLDGDGLLDIATTGAPFGGVGSCTLHFQLLGPSFVGQELPVSGSLVSALDLGDVDLDGDLDVVFGVDSFGQAAEVNGRVKLFRQTSPGTFTDAATLSHDRSDGPRSVRIADVTNDGLPDISFFCAEFFLFAQGFFGDTLAIFEQRPDGGFNQSSYPLLEQSFPFIDGDDGFPVGFEVVDLDGDGNLDFLLGTDTSGPEQAPEVTYHRGRGIFQARSDGPLLPPGPGRVGALGDIDGDGDLDVAYSEIDPSQIDGKLGIVLQTDSNQFVDRGIVFATDIATAFNPRALRVVDFTADGRADLVVHNAADGSPSSTAQIERFVQDAAGNFLPESVFNAGAADGGFGRGIPSTPFTVEDFDVDGRPDALIGAVFEPQSDEAATLVFADSTRVALSRHTEDFGAADFDGNGLIDIVGAVSRILTSEDIGVFLHSSPQVLGQAGPQFGERVANFTLGSIPGARTVAAADFDDDGLADIVGAGADLFVFLQVPGDGSLDADDFPLSTSVSSGSTFAFELLEPVDLDLDGDLDLIASGNLTQLRAFEQVAPGRFDPDPQGVLFPQGIPEAGGTEFADIEGDGDIDVIFDNLNVLFGNR